MPIRTSAIHIVNQNWVFSAAFNIIKPFLNAANREKLFIHGTDMSSLHKHISPEHLPKRYKRFFCIGNSRFELNSKNNSNLGMVAFMTTIPISYGLTICKKIPQFRKNLNKLDMFLSNFYLCI